MAVKLGYKQTDVGVIPEEWEVFGLGQICLFENGDRSSNYPSPGSFRKSGIPFINAGHIAHGRVSENEMNYITQEAYDRLGGGKVKTGDILFCLRGSLGKFGIVTGSFGTGAIASSLVIIRSKETLVSREYLRCYFGSSLCAKMIEAWSGGAAQPNLGAKELARFSVPLPPLSEQRAIAAAFGDVEALLVLLEQLIAKKRGLKQAAMHQLLTGQTRLPGFSGAWEETTLGAIGECIIGLTYHPDNVVEHGLLVLRSSNVQGGRLAYENNVYVDLKVNDRLITKPGDILVCVRNGSRTLIGKSAVIDEAAAGTTFGAFMTVYRTVHWRFISHAFQSESIQRQIRDNIGATINQITNKDMKALRLKLPAACEQIAIATVLTDMDAELVALEQRLAKTRALKQGMMQELLTGRTRLV